MENTNPIKNIIEQLKNAHYQSQGHHILTTYYEDYIKYKIEHKEALAEIAYNILYGILWGLAITDTITDKQRNEATNFIIYYDIDNQEGERL